MSVTIIDDRDILEFSLFIKVIIYFMIFAVLKNYLQTHSIELINQHVHDADKFILSIFILYASNAFFFCLKIIKFQPENPSCFASFLI